ncbi:winged helix-turn-helix transcriptional regulator [Rhizobium sp. ARZ01]|uniref:ArsR/SmtB family transcription factor n=1 Tax=Rhizobium sp. ARZ01 TaxID=2769313 RepID=UPI0017804D08|nr:metalloregulator ArsR/SmtB family transcription factor [Rhizobium sp. ARZ01]MBD9373593.1 winged helix-turn-helix transcriptional regulator [Rhizobium sp. ARZ01]
MTYDYRQMAALADPTRRQVFELIVQKPRSVAELTRSLPVSQPAVSQHLKALRDANLVRAEARGASNVYHIDPNGLGEMRAWLDSIWTDALGSFREAINESVEARE